MKKLIFMLALASVTVAAMADEKAVVVNDTRQYSPYAQPTGIKPPVVGGEWEIRVGEFCREEAYSLGSKNVNEFKCDDHGNPV